jgi:hypothetical protein
MERFLLLWDELDDWTGACRHLTASAVNEVSGLTAPLAVVASALGGWVMLSHSRLLAALHAVTQGSYRDLLP